MKKITFFTVLAAIILAILTGSYFFVIHGIPISPQWNTRLDQAFSTTDCEPIQQASLPSNYYQGPMIDTHFHMPALDDEFSENNKTIDPNEVRGADSHLYDQIADDDRPLLGRTLTVDQVACTLSQEGTLAAFTFFPVYPDAEMPMIKLVDLTMKRYPNLFVPFIQASGTHVATVEGSVLDNMLAIKPHLFNGIGETGDSPTEPINPPPDSKIYTEIFTIARKHNLPVYFHPGEGHHQHLDRALKQFPDVIFIVHGDFVRPHIDQLLATNPNLYFTANDIFEELIPQFRFGEKDAFVNAMEKNWDKLLAQALRTYQPLIEKYPDRFMWGTDRADIAWNYHSDIGILLSRYGRAFIGQLDPSVREKFAYQNAERLFQ